ncbi:acyl carrier protein [Actinokineospora alba]|uniref:Acyl carrier protein n=1 Tax=Actinokineospora alba TaxID=504798 RepID=A0A1H0USU1_9PSEU|nr:phosphopantetheine-binding protein [Actinokineospora alba]TDP69088.1 acyl carrier protein [Actinokineospora alba]SDI79296.1 acyl carrier protein [Actinokineospora alba]SDP69183.1 acyl carrier protein [Actinokineospora alba]
MTTTPITEVPSQQAVLEEISSMLLRVLDQYGLDDVDITMETTFHDELGLESIDLVTVGSMLTDRYGEQVNLAAFLADLDIDDVIGMRVGLLVDFVRTALSRLRLAGS